MQNKIQLLFLIITIVTCYNNNEEYKYGDKEKNNFSFSLSFNDYLWNKLSFNPFNSEEFEKYYSGFFVLAKEFYDFFMTDFHYENKKAAFKKMDEESNIF